MTTYLLAGGGTAGHVNPLLAVADGLRRRDPDAVILVLGTAEGLESRLVPERGFELLVIPRLPFPRRPSRDALRFPGRFRGLVASIGEILSSREVDVVVGFGGYVSAPAYLAARRAGVAIAVHEANARPGMANRLGSLLTPFVGVAHDGTALRHAVVVGMPLRPEIVTLDRYSARSVAYAELGLDRRLSTLLVTGGSLGARRLNETIARSASLLLGSRWQVLHLAGAAADTPFPQLPGYRVLSYCDRMDLALAVADLVVARSGSSTVSELTALGIPAVYVPLAIGNGEQRLNARESVRAGSSILVDNAAFTPEWVADRLVPLMNNPELLARMTAKAATIGVRDGTERMIALIDNAVSPRGVS